MLSKIKINRKRAARPKVSRPGGLKLFMNERRVTATQIKDVPLFASARQRRDSMATSAASYRCEHDTGWTVSWRGAVCGMGRLHFAAALRVAQLWAHLPIPRIMF